MPLVNLESIHFAIGDRVLLHDASLYVDAGEKVCVVGRNGAGKSTLFKLIRGQLHPEDGKVDLQRDVRVSVVDQALPEATAQTVAAFVTEGLGDLASQIEAYRQLSAASGTDQDLDALHRLQHDIEAAGGWQLETLVARTLSELDLPAESTMASLSGGWRRRASLARALVSRPDLLLLDEPTNHLDLSTVEWLERRLRNFNGAVLFVTHDRAFMQHLATRIVELDRGRLTSWPGDYANFLQRKEEHLEAEARANALFDKRLAEEEAWIRQGIKARRTRNEGRVRALKSMREVFAQRVKREGSARIEIETAEQSGRKVIEANNLRHGYGNDILVDGLSLKIMRGDRIGLVGNNGVGKSTLLRLLLGEMEPDQGNVKQGTNLEIGYFDQLRRDLDPQRTVADIVGNGRDFIDLNGRQRHIISYLRGFLFSAERAQTKVGALSGGECNRVILARLLARPTNLLVLDEPTNDLDVETLEVLEEQLCEYPGTLIIVSHDREFLDNVVTSILVFEEGGRIEQYPGGYSDWQRRGLRLQERDRLAATVAIGEPQRAVAAAAPRTPRKLSYKLQRELDGLPTQIETLEADIEGLNEQTRAAGFYDQDYDRNVAPVLKQLESLQRALERAMVRWDELETMQRQLEQGARE